MKCKLVLLGHCRLTLQGLEMLLKDEMVIEDIISPVVEEEIHQRLHDIKPDVVVMDIKPGTSITTLNPHITSIGQISPLTNIVVLLTCCDKLLIRNIINAGVTGCLLKTDVSIQSLRKAISGVRQGNVIYSQTVSNLYFKQKDYSLNSQDLKVLQLIKQGMTNQQIANHLQIAVSSAKRYVSLVYDKLEVSHAQGNPRVMAVEKAMRLGFLQCRCDNT